MKPLSTVAKSFQVPVWQDICQCWSALADEEKEQLASSYNGAC
jgi:hypothetical protein